MFQHNYKCCIVTIVLHELIAGGQCGNTVCVPSAGTADPHPAAEALRTSVAVEPAECSCGRPHYQFWVEKQRSVSRLVSYGYQFFC